MNIHNLNGTRVGIEEKISSITGNTIYVSPEKKMVSYFPYALLVLILAGVFLIYKIN